MNPTLSEISGKFIGNQKIIDIAEYGNGHINKTYLITAEHGKYILQKVNSLVFNTGNLEKNYENLVGYTESKGLTGKFFPTFHRSVDGNIHERDLDDNLWRVMSFINKSHSFQISPNPDLSQQAGVAMARFQHMLNQLPSNLFYPTIDNFHNPNNRINDFKDTIKNQGTERYKEAKEEINYAVEHYSIADIISEALAAGSLPNRITHNDTKLENILFVDSNEPLVIDLDTVMPGSVIFDFGDMVRSITGISKEDERNLSKVRFNTEHFESLSRGYLTTIKDDLSADEKELMYPGIICIIYIQGIRFLTDFLAGDIYYNTNYTNHNLIRCRTQFHLLKQIMDKKDKVAFLIQKHL